MKFAYALTLLAIFCIGTASFVGCDQDAKKGDEHSHKDGDGHDHDGKDGDKVPAMGPNKGHTIVLKGTDKIGEWVHYKDSDMIRFFLWENKELKKPVSFDGVTVTPTAGDDKSPIKLELDAENANNKGDEKLVYMLEDTRLKNAFNFGVDVEFAVGDDKFTAKIDAHEHHDH